MACSLFSLMGGTRQKINKTQNRKPMSIKNLIIKQSQCRRRQYDRFQYQNVPLQARLSVPYRRMMHHASCLLLVYRFVVITTTASVSCACCVSTNFSRCLLVYSPNQDADVTAAAACTADIAYYLIDACHFGEFRQTRAAGWHRHNTSRRRP